MATYLAPVTGKMNQILGCDWLPERASWHYFVRSGLPAVSRKIIVYFFHIIDLFFFIKLVRSVWLCLSP